MTLADVLLAIVRRGNTVVKPVEGQSRPDGRQDSSRYTCSSDAPDNVNDVCRMSSPLLCLARFVTVALTKVLACSSPKQSAFDRFFVEQLGPRNQEQQIELTWAFDSRSPLPAILAIAVCLRQDSCASQMDKVEGGCIIASASRKKAWAVHKACHAAC